MGGSLPSSRCFSLSSRPRSAAATRRKALRVDDHGPLHRSTEIQPIQRSVRRGFRRVTQHDGDRLAIALRDDPAPASLAPSPIAPTERPAFPRSSRVQGNSSRRSRFPSVTTARPPNPAVSSRIANPIRLLPVFSACSPNCRQDQADVFGGDRRSFLIQASNQPLKMSF